MDILKFEILDKNDEVVKVDNEQVHVKKASGEFAVYTLKLDEKNQIIGFNVLAVTRGSGSISLTVDADLNDLADTWGSEDA